MGDFNVDNLLNMEKRTGIKKDDIESFLERAKEVEKKIDDIKSGRISCEQLAAEHEADMAEKAAEAARKAKRLAAIAKRDAERKVRDAAEEKEKWWQGADVLFGEEVDADGAADAILDGESGESAREAALRKYENDYSKWAEARWTPDDPATVAERDAEEKAKTDAENANFEKNNKGFCDDFVADQAVREKSRQKKEETAAAKRLKGNRYFKRKKFAAALALYMESLAVRPYERATLLNAAQVFLKQKRWDDAHEFASRAVRVSLGDGADFRAKARSRRAEALLRRAAPGDLDACVADLKAAADALTTSSSAASADLAVGGRAESRAPSAGSDARGITFEPLSLARIDLAFRGFVGTGRFV